METFFTLPLLILLTGIVISVAIVNDMCRKRGIPSGVWIFASIFIAWFSPIILGMIIRTIDAEAKRQIMIEIEKEKLYKQLETKKQKNEITK